MFEVPTHPDQKVTTSGIADKAACYNVICNAVAQVHINIKEGGAIIIRYTVNKLIALFSEIV